MNISIAKGVQGKAKAGRGKCGWKGIHIAQGLFVDCAAMQHFFSQSPGLNE